MIGFVLAGAGTHGFQIEVSSGGSTWQPQTAVGSAGSSISAFAANAKTVIAVGSSGSQPVRTGAWLTTGGGLWLQGDGTAFAPKVIQGAGANTTASDVTWTGKAFVSVGIEYACAGPGPCDDPPSVVALWSSPDGQTWSRINLGKNQISQPIPSIVASGKLVLAYGSANGTSLLSKDSGATWSVVHAAKRIAPVIAISNGFMGIQDGNVLTTTDGVRWHKIGSVDATGIDHWAGLLAIDGGYVLAGVSFPTADQVPVDEVFVSKDAKAWSALPADPALKGIELVDLATDGPNVVAYAHEAPLTAASWRGTLEADATALLAAAP